MQKRSQKSTGNSPADRRFAVFYRQGWVYLVIHPTTEGSQQVYADEVENRMRLLGMPRADTIEIRNIIASADGFAHRLIEWPDGKQLASDIKIRISDDEMTANLEVSAPRKGAAPPLASELIQALHQAGVTEGIDEAALERIVQQRLFQQETAVAHGTQPVFGSAHRIKYHFSEERGRPYLLMDFDRINLKELHFIEMTEQDKLLAELLPPIEPVDGVTVTGRIVPAASDERTTALQAGSNTRLSPDGTQLFAECMGNVKLVDGVVMVEPVVTVADVDYSTGNIDFDGSVVIEGGVADGFTVTATGDIQVAKGVGRAQLQAGGSILLQSGMNGNGSGCLASGRDILAKYLESCSVTCHGNLLVEEAIMHSSAKVRGHCLLSGRRAEIIGGELQAGASCWCKKLGNLNEQSTVVSIGISPELLEEYRSACRENERCRDSISDTRIKLDQLEQAESKGLKSAKIDEARSALNKRLVEENHLKTQLQERIPVLREQLTSAKDSMLIVENTIFPGATVEFGHQEYRAPDQGARKTILTFRGGRIVESGFDLRNKPVLRF